MYTYSQYGKKDTPQEIQYPTCRTGKRKYPLDCELCLLSIYILKKKLRCRLHREILPNSEIFQSYNLVLTSSLLCLVNFTLGHRTEYLSVKQFSNYDGLTFGSRNVKFLFNR